jgi:hypothetical protein
MKRTVIFISMILFFVSSSFALPQMSWVIPGYDTIKPGFDYTQIPTGIQIHTCVEKKISKSDNNAENFHAILSNNRIVWTKKTKENNYDVYKMYLWDVGSQSDHGVKLQPDNENNLLNSFDNNKIIYRNKLGANATYRLLDISNNIAASPVDIGMSNIFLYGVSIHDNKIVYAKHDGNDYEIYLKNGNFTTKITDNNYDDRYPAIHNGKIAWECKNGSDWEICYFDGQHITQITDNAEDDYSASVYNNKVVWQHFDGQDNEIYFWNGNTITQVTNNNYSDYSPKVYGEDVIWFGKPSGDYELFYWNTDSNSGVEQVTSNNVDDKHPSIYNGRIAWVRDKNVYTCEVNPPLKPTVITYNAENITTTSAKLEGKVNPNKQSTSYRFVYGTTNFYGHATNWVSAGSGDTSQTVSKTISGLTSDTTYHYRIEAKNASGTSYGTDKTFKTKPPVPILPSATTKDNVTGDWPYTLSAIINPNGFDTTYYFQYGTTSSYGFTTSEASAGNGTSNITVTAQVSNLEPNTPYHFRIVAENAAGIVRGDDETFTTGDAPDSKMSVPNGEHIFNYLSTEEPILNVNPSIAKPFAIGNIMAGTLNLKISLPEFDNPVDIYVGISLDKIGGIFLIDSSNNFHNINDRIDAWKTNQTEAINESLFGNISIASLPNNLHGNYRLYLLIVPTGATNTQNSYLWITNFTIH